MIRMNYDISNRKRKIVFLLLFTAIAINIGRRTFYIRTYIAIHINNTCIQTWQITTDDQQTQHALVSDKS